MKKFHSRYKEVIVGFVIAILAFNVAALGFSSSIENDAAENDKFLRWEVVGPSGGDVRVVAIDPQDKDKVYISTLDGQIYKSPDGGASWSLLVNLNEPQLILDQLMVDANDSKSIYASGHRHKSPGGFFYSNDGGKSWNESKQLKGESIHSMTQSSFNKKVLTVGTTGGVWISNNSGRDWEKLTSPTTPVNVDSLAIDPRNSSTIYAGTWWRAYKTTDSGKNWRLIKNGMIDDSDVFAISIDPDNPEHIVASACSGIYESRNGGDLWAKIQGIPSQSRRTRDILQNPTVKGAIYAATTEGFWMSSNGGKSWALTTQRTLEVNSIAVHPEVPNRIFIGTNNFGVMVSNDGGRNFAATNGNFTSRFASSITADHKDPNRLYATTQNTATGGGYFFLSSDRGRTWQQARNLDAGRIVPFTLLQDETNPSLMYLGTNAGIYRSLDRGDSWAPLQEALTAPKPPVPKSTRQPVKRGRTNKAAAAKPKAAPPVVTAPIEATPGLVDSLKGKIKLLGASKDGTNALYAATDSGLYVSRDLTKGWEKLELGPGVDNSIFSFHTTALRPETLWIGTATSGVLKSRDNGKTWERMGGAVDNVPVSSIATDPERPDYVYVGTTQTFYLSRDGGATWMRRGGNLPLGNYTSILINPNNTDEVIIASSLESDGGMYQSLDAGGKWKRIDTKEMNLPSRRVWSLAMDPTDPNRIFAGTHSSGVYILERRGNSASLTEKEEPSKTAN